MDPTRGRHEGEPSAPETFVWNRNGFGMPDGGIARAFERDRIEIGGRRYDCWRVAVYSRIGQRFYWISEEIPVHGVLKVAGVVNGAADEAHAVRLTAWGFKEK
jgi:hypothetical protein